MRSAPCAPAEPFGWPCIRKVLHCPLASCLRTSGTGSGWVLGLCGVGGGVAAGPRGYLGTQVSFCPGVPDPWAACPGEAPAKGRTQGTSVVSGPTSDAAQGPWASEARPGLGALASWDSAAWRGLNCCWKPAFRA